MMLERANTLCMGGKLTAAERVLVDAAHDANSEANSERLETALRLLRNEMREREERHVQEQPLPSVNRANSWSDFPQ